MMFSVSVCWSCFAVLMVLFLIVLFGCFVLENIEGDEVGECFDGVDND